jgi:hypothetical protein
MTATLRKAANPWKKGQSGNPAGRPPGRSPITKLRESLMGDVPDILVGLVAAAKAGDVQAARLILERVLPPVKPVEQPVEINLPDGTLTDQGRAVLDSVASGGLSPGQGSQLLGAIAQLARVAEIDELEKRMTAMEQRHGKN